MKKKEWKEPVPGKKIKIAGPKWVAIHKFKTGRERIVLMALPKETKLGLYVAGKCPYGTHGRV